MYIYAGVGTEIFINNNEQKQMTQKILFLFRLVPALLNGMEWNEPITVQCYIIY